MAGARGYELPYPVGAGPGPSSPAQPSTFRFDPSASAAPGNVYRTWPALFAAVRNVKGPRVVEFTPGARIPAGAYDFGDFNVRFVGSTAKGAGFGDFRTAITIAAGVTFPNNPPYDFERLDITFEGAAPAIVVSSGVAAFNFRGTTFLETTGGAPFIRAQGTAYVVLNLFDQSILTSGYGVGASGAGAVMFVGGFDDGTLYNDVVQALGGGSLLFFTYSATASADLRQSGLPGGFFVMGTTYILQAAADFTYYGQGAAFPFLPLGDTTGGYPSLSSFLNALKSFIAGAPGADLGNADAGIDLAGGYWRNLPAATLTGNRVYTLNAPGANKTGQQITITRHGTEAFTARLNNPDGSEVYTFPASARGFCKVQWTGAAWVAREFS